MPIAVITGVTGQDGYLLAKYLLEEKKYVVHGIVRRAAEPSERLDKLLAHPNFTRHYGDMSDMASLQRVLLQVVPDELYNLAAQSHVGVSFDCPESTADVDALGVLRLLETLRSFPQLWKVRLYQASSSEMFGDAPSPQGLDSPFRPRSVYAISKVFAHHCVNLYREAYGIYACCGVLFNHESPDRGREFVTQKIVRGLVRIHTTDDKTPLMLGNIRSKRDWGHAEDYVRAMHLMLQQPKPKDYVIAMGESRSVQEFVDAVARVLGMDLAWYGFPLQAYDVKRKQCVVRIEPSLYRPLDVPDLRGDPGDSFEALGWKPKKSFLDLVKDMVSHVLSLPRGSA